MKHKKRAVGFKPARSHELNFYLHRPTDARLWRIRSWRQRSTLRLLRGAEPAEHRGAPLPAGEHRAPAGALVPQLGVRAGVFITKFHFRQRNSDVFDQLQTERRVETSRALRYELSPSRCWTPRGRRTPRCGKCSGGKDVTKLGTVSCS